MALFDTVSPEMMRSGQMLTGAVLALWLGVGYVPALRPYAGRIRLAVLAAYLVGAIALVAYAVYSR
jgi:hypothetical protein